MEHAHLIDHLRQETQLFFDLAVNLSGSLEVKEILRRHDHRSGQGPGGEGRLHPPPG